MPLTVLIVEDEDILRKAIAFEFTMSDWTVLEAPQITKAKELLSEHKVDVIVSDVRMPGGTGFDLLGDVKKAQPHLPFILMTAFADLDWEQIYHGGADSYLSKPIKLSTLVNEAGRLVVPFAERIAANSKKASSPTRELVIEKNFESLERAQLAHKLKIGRGGFFIELRDDFPCEDDIIKVKLRFTQGDCPILDAMVKVRWVRTDPNKEGLSSGCGVELISISDLAHPVLGLIRSCTDVAFIPRG